MFVNFVCSYVFRYPPFDIIVEENNIIINSFATSSGFNLFFPNPPNIIFVIVATRDPSITIVNGVFNGSIKPKNSPGKILYVFFRVSFIFFVFISLNKDKAITRAEAVAMMDLFLDDVSDQISFTDVSWSTRFRSSIIKAYANGLINGYPDGSFKPGNPISRAEMAAIFNRYITGKIYEF